MATYQSDFRVKYQDEFQVRWSVENAKAASEMAGRTPVTEDNATSPVGAVYGGTILGEDSRADRN
jgi:hypothetical protein